LELLGPSAPSGSLEIMDYSASTAISMATYRQHARHLQGVQSAQVLTGGLNVSNRQT
jgi:hypothetical protein